jgi:myosin-5
MEIMDGDRRRKQGAITRPALGQDSPARRLIAWLQLFFKDFVQRYGWLARWDAAGRPAFLLLFAFLVQRHMRRSYLSQQKSRLQRQVTAAVTVQAACRAMAARREFSLRRQTRAAVCIQAQWRAHKELWSYLTMKRASVICQCAWRQSIARRHLGKLRLVLSWLPLPIFYCSHRHNSWCVGLSSI